MKGLNCENAKELAQRLHDCLKTKHKNYILRPFNRFDVEKSMWWIVPSKVFPAYRFGKYMIDESEDGTFSVGIHIEKGLEHAVDYKKNLILDDEWVWHEFIQAVGNGKVEEILLSISDRMKDAVEISILVCIPKAEEKLSYSLENGRFINQATKEVEDIKLIPSWINNFPQIE